MKKTLIKTDKVIKVNPWNVTGFYRFIKHYIGWNPEDYLKELSKRSPKNKRLPKAYRDHTDVRIPLDIVIIPSYMVSRVPKTLQHVVIPERKDIISPENFSYFNVYKVVDDPYGEITKTYISVSVYPRESEELVRIQAMMVKVEYLYSYYADESLYFKAQLERGLITERLLTEALEYLIRADGKSYSDLPHEDPMLTVRLLDIEESLTSFLNFLYALHTHKFEGNDMASWLFKPYSDLIRGYGCDFEEALSVVEFASALLPSRGE
jgi:hypothetical protein